jgi:hypothetical protein
MVLLLGLMLAVGAPLAERDVRGVVDGWLAAQNAGDFGDIDSWKEMNEEVVARQAWEMGTKVLVADVDKPCEGAFWAQPAGAAAPATERAVDSDGDGNSELLFEPASGSYGTEKGRLLLEGELWDNTEELTVPYMDCPC